MEPSIPKNNSLLIPIIISVIWTAFFVGVITFWWTNNRIKQEFGDESSQLIEAQIKLAIRDFWDVKEVFMHPAKKTEFYYITHDTSGYSIWVYDQSKDEASQQPNGSFNISEVSRLLLREKLPEYKEFFGIGAIENKFVFAVIDNDYSPGPCSSPWLYPNLWYIDIDVAKPTRMPFTVPKGLEEQERQNASYCEKTF